MDYIVDYQQAKQLPDPLFIDLRTSHEFAKEHIVGAISMPILTDKEYQEVGTLYKHVSYDAAKIRAIQDVSQALPEIFEQLLKESKQHSLILYCDRGGYRSSVLFTLLRALDVHVFKLTGGYKNYRAFIRQELANLIPQFTYITLSGYTGAGKTELLMQLNEQGANVLDLEALANHRGSLLGQVGRGEQPSQKQFESLLYEELRKLDTARPVFIENESVRIGRLEVPSPLKKAYDQSQHQLLITAPLNERVCRLEEEYVEQHSEHQDQELIQGLLKLKRYLSTAHVEKLIQGVNKGDYKPVIEDLIIHYYDPSYKIAHSNYERVIEYKRGQNTVAKLLDYAQRI